MCYTVVCQYEGVVDDKINGNDILEALHDFAGEGLEICLLSNKGRHLDKALIHSMESRGYSFLTTQVFGESKITAEVLNGLLEKFGGNLSMAFITNKPRESKIAEEKGILTVCLEKKKSVFETLKPLYDYAYNYKND